MQHFIHQIERLLSAVHAQIGTVDLMTTLQAIGLEHVRSWFIRFVKEEFLRPSKVEKFKEIERNVVNKTIQ